MKLSYFRYIVLFTILQGTVGCSIFEEPNPFRDPETPIVDMTFNGTNFNNVSTTAAETDEVTVTVNLSNTDVTSVRVDSRFRNDETIAPATAPATRSRTLTTLTAVNQVATFKMMVRNMGSTPDAGTPTGGQSVVLEFVAIGNGKTATRRFTIGIVRPLTLLATRTPGTAASPGSALTAAPNQARNPSSASPNQAIFLGYASTGALTGQRLTKVEVFRRIGFAGTEDVAPIASKSYPAGGSNVTADSLAYTIPNTDAIGSTIFLRYVGTFANGQTVVLNATSASGNPRIAVVGNALQDVRTGLQMISNLPTSITGLNTSYNFASVAFNGTGTDEAVKDMIMTGNGFRSGTGNGTTFVAVPSTFAFNTATFQTAETAYNAGTAVTSIGAEMATNNIFVCRIRNRTGLDQYGAIRITTFVPNTNPAAATFTFDFRSLRP